MKKLPMIMAFALMTSTAFAACPNLEGDYICDGYQEVTIAQQIIQMPNNKNFINYRISLGADAQNFYSDNQKRPFRDMTDQASCTSDNALQVVRRMWGTKTTMRYELDDQNNLKSSVSYIGFPSIVMNCIRQ